MTFGLDEVGSIRGLEKIPSGPFRIDQNAIVMKLGSGSFCCNTKIQNKNDSVVVEVVVVVVGRFPST